MLRVFHASYIFNDLSGVERGLIGVCMTEFLTGWVDRVIDLLLGLSSWEEIMLRG